MRAVVELDLELARRTPCTRASRPSHAFATVGGEVDGDEALARAADTAEGEQVVDQQLHALGAVDGEGDVLVGALVELAAVALLEQLAEARHLAQRLLQVVRRDVGELLEVGVGPGELGGPALEPAPLLLDLGEHADELEPHRLDARAHLAEVGRALGPDRRACARRATPRRPARPRRLIGRSTAVCSARCSPTTAATTATAISAEDDHDELPVAVGLVAGPSLTCRASCGVEGRVGLRAPARTAPGRTGSCCPTPRRSRRRCAATRTGRARR